MAERSGPSYASSAEDRLPWLEPVEDDAADYAVPRGRLAGGVIAALVVIAVVVGGLFWLREPRPQAASSEIALITAPAGNYKSRPENPGGMKVAGQGDTVYQASQGADPNATIDTAATPEAPVRPPHGVKLATAAPVKAPAATATATAPAKPATKPAQVAIKTVPPVAKPSTTTVALPPPTAKPAAGGVAIQLGAFSSQASADAAWKSLSGRFASLGGLSKNVVAAPKGSGTVYRLRASGAGAADVCGKLKVAGESCVVIRD
jgi:cell division septation protein DedD